MPKPIERWASEVDDTEHPTKQACEAHEAMQRDILSHISTAYSEGIAKNVTAMMVQWCRSRGVDPQKLKLQQPTLALAPPDDEQKGQD